jgi:ATP phosphoribosyltransferase regulatory subunit HisZ
MSRCIAEDFNVESIVEYVEEFMKALYREIEFNALVEEYEYRIGDAEVEAKKLRKAAEKSVMSRLTKSDEFDFIAECDDQSRLPWFCGDD